MNKIILSLTFLFLLLNSSLAQRHDLIVAGGVAGFNSGYSSPSGMTGASCKLMYNKTRFALDTHRQWSYIIQANYAHLRSPHTSGYLKTPSYNIQGKASVAHLWHFTEDEYPFNYWLGAFAAFGATVTYPYDAIYYYQGGVVDINYGITLGFSAKLRYQFKHFSLENVVQVPFVYGGYAIPFTESIYDYIYPDSDWRHLVNLFSPNTITSIHNYRAFDNRMSIVFPYKKIEVLATYFFEYQYSYLHFVESQYLQHALGVGVRF